MVHLRYIDAPFNVLLVSVASENDSEEEEEEEEVPSGADDENEDPDYMKPKFGKRKYICPKPFAWL